MQKTTTSQSGIFNPRVLFAFTLCSAGVLLAMFSFAAPTPPSETTRSLVKSPGGALFSEKDSNAAASTVASTSTAAGNWNIVSSPNARPSEENYLVSVACVAASDCWAVGSAGSFFSGSAYQTLTEHWDGNSWAIIASDNTDPAKANSLQGVTCVTASDCWAVGYARPLIPNFSNAYQTLTEHWDGNSWAIVASANTPPDLGLPTPKNGDNVLRSVNCVTTSDCWAVGYALSYRTGTYQSITEHWNGTSWLLVDSGSADRAQDKVLLSVTCVAASDCWAVGYTYSPRNYQSLTEHWDGSSWTIIASANTSPTKDNILLGVTCAAASDCWAAGYAFSGSAYQTLTEHWDGSSWMIVSAVNASTSQDNFFSSVTCVAATDCWAVGNAFSGTLTEHWNGNSWAIVDSPSISPTNGNFLHGVTCTSASDCWTVGYYYVGSIPQTLIEHYTVSPMPLSGVVSRKTHGSAGDFAIDLPLTGNPGIECRSGGAGGDYKIVFTFANPVTVNGTPDMARVTSGIGTVSSVAVNGAEVTVDLTGVTNAQKIILTLFNVSDATNTGNVSVPMALLIGDVNGSDGVTNGDVGTVKAQVGAPVTSLNFRDDVNENGTLSNGDVSMTKAQVGTTLP